eukprot:sb/3470355/
MIRQFVLVGLLCTLTQSLPTSDIIVFPLPRSTDNYIRTTISDGTGEWNEMTVSTWFYPIETGSGGARSIFSYMKESNSAGNDLLLYISSENTFRGYIDDRIFEESQLEDPSFYFNESRWYHLAFTWKNDTAAIYVDGHILHQWVNSQFPTGISKKGMLVVGQDQNTYGGGFGLGDAFLGKLSGLVWLDRRLSDQEVKWIYEGKLNPG